MGAGKRLVLFDIDGTIMSTGGIGRQCFHRAIEAVHGPLPQAAGWRFAGKTDPQICQELLAEAGVAPEAIARLTPAVLDHYLDGLEAGLKTAPECHLKPGVRELLAALASHSNATIGLLTGNVERGARIKLAHFSLLPYFALGAFGSDHADRRALPAIALDRAASATGHRHVGKEIVIIGDTEHDIRCGEAHGVRTIAVATGPFSAEDLASHGADHVFADLAETDRVLEAILG